MTSKSLLAWVWLAALTLWFGFVYGGILWFVPGFSVSGFLLIQGYNAKSESTA